MSRLFNLSDRVRLGDDDYAINTDFRVWIEIEALLFDEALEPVVRFAKILALAYPVLPQNPRSAVQGIMWFYSGGEEVPDAAEAGHSALPCCDLAEDFDYIWGGFMSQYGLDLTEVHMHWWKFRTLIACLDDNCRFSRIVSFRCMDTSKIRDNEQRRYYEKMKKRYRLRRGQASVEGEVQVAESLEELF